jgi:hypothetical protein
MSLTSYQAAPPCNKGAVNVRTGFWRVNGDFEVFGERSCALLGPSLFSALPVPSTQPNETHRGALFGTGQGTRTSQIARRPSWPTCVFDPTYIDP